MGRKKRRGKFFKKFKGFGRKIGGFVKKSGGAIRKVATFLGTTASIGGSLGIIPGGGFIGGALSKMSGVVNKARNIQKLAVSIPKIVKATSRSGVVKTNKIAETLTKNKIAPTPQNVQILTNVIQDEVKTKSGSMTPPPVMETRATAEVVANESGTSTLKQKVLAFYSKYKKPVIIAAIAIPVIGIGLFIFLKKGKRGSKGRSY